MDGAEGSQVAQTLGNTSAAPHPCLLSGYPRAPQPLCTGWFLISLSLSCYLLSIPCHPHLLLFFPSFFFLAAPFLLLSYRPIPGFVRFITRSLISPCFSPLLAILFSTFAPQSTSPCLLKNKKEQKRDICNKAYTNIPTAAQVPVLVRMPHHLLLSPLSLDSSIMSLLLHGQSLGWRLTFNSFVRCPGIAPIFLWGT